MRIVPALLGVAILAVGTAAHAQEACPIDQFPKPQIIVHRETTPDPPIDTSKGMAELSSMREAHGEKQAAGLTSARSSYNVSIQVQVLQLPSGKICAAPAKVEVRLAVDDMRIYVAKRFEKGSCAYEEILEHERRHVDIHNEMIGQAAEAVERALRKALADRRVDRAESPEAAVKEIQGRLNKVVQEAFQKVKKEADARQAEFDRREGEKGYLPEGEC
jgi:hypothetical protein